MTALEKCPMSKLSVSRLSLMKCRWAPELIFNVMNFGQILGKVF